MSGIRYILNGQVSDVVVVTNWRGDVEALYDLNGALVAKYTYDAWGNQSSIRDKNGSEITSPTHIATVNPFRYRGYYLDTETSLYYLKARYYDAQTHRMLNEDVLVGGNSEFQSNNLFLYCGNNPVNRLDDTGNLWKWVEKAKNKVVQTYNKCKTWVKGVFNGSAVSAADSVVHKVVQRIPDAKWEVDWTEVEINAGAGQVGNCLNYTRRVIKGAKAIKAVSKVAGVVSTVLAAIDVGVDISRYQGSEMWQAIGMDAGLFAVGIGFGAVASVCTGGIAAIVLGVGIIGTTAIGIAVENKKDTFKKKW